MKTVIAIIVTYLLAHSNISAQYSSQTPALKVPSFTFYYQNKTAFTEKNIAQNKQLFFFFFDCDCEHCQQAMKNLNADFKNYRNVSIYLISANDWQKIYPFIKTYGPDVASQKNITLLQDPKNQFNIQFKPLKYPAMFLYGVDKKLLDYEDNAESMFRFTNQLNTAAR